MKMNTRGKLVFLLVILITIASILVFIHYKYGVREFLFKVERTLRQEYVDIELIKKYVSVRQRVDSEIQKSKGVVNRRSSSFQKINFSENGDKKKLNLKWTFDFGKPQNVEAPPLVCGGHLILALPTGEVFGIDPNSGALVWNTSFEQYSPIARRGFACYPASQGFYALAPSSRGILCISTRTGRIDREVCGSGILGNSLSLIEPEIFEDTIFVGTVHPAGVEAFNFKTGKRLWGNVFDRLDGSNPWSGLTFDRENKQLIVSTGTPSNWMDISTSNKKYSFSNSLISLDFFSGEKRWQFQEADKDFWDHDFVGKPNVFFSEAHNKTVVVGLSKSGTVFFLDAKSGAPLSQWKTRTHDFGNLTVDRKQFKSFPNLLGDYQSMIPTGVTLPNGNSGVVGFVPPLIKKFRIVEGYSGGPQWPGASLDLKNNQLVVTSNRNVLFGQFTDLYPSRGLNIEDEYLSEKCTSCHSNEGLVRQIDGKTVPSLFLTSYLYGSRDDLMSYLTFDNTHAPHAKNIQDTDRLFLSLRKYDSEVIRNSNISIFNNYEFDYHRGLSKIFGQPPYGLVTAISLSDFKVLWQVPSGFIVESDSQAIEGSPSYAGVKTIPRENLYIFAGSFDNKVYLIDAVKGSYLDSEDIAATASAPPLTLDDQKGGKWIFIVSGGGRSSPEDLGSLLYAFQLE